MAMESACCVIFSLVSFTVNVPSGKLENIFRETVFHCSTDIIKDGGVFSLTSRVWLLCVLLSFSVSELSLAIKVDCFCLGPDFGFFRIVILSLYNVRSSA